MQVEMTIISQRDTISVGDLLQIWGDTPFLNARDVVEKDTDARII